MDRERSDELTAVAGALSRALPQDPAASPARVGRVLRRARRGGRIDDVIRGELTLTSSVWLLGVLVRRGLAELSVNGALVPLEWPARGRGTHDDALLDTGAAEDLIDWPLMESIHARRRFTPDLAYFQAGDTFVSLRRRMALMAAHDDLDGRVVLQLGDDNMFGVALGLVPGIGHVHVADIDTRLLGAIDAEARSLRLPITTHEVDVLRSRVPVEAVDTFFVSNLKDAGGLMACTAVAVAAAGGAGRAGYVSFAPDAYRAGFDDRRVLHSVSQLFGKLDCVLTDLVPCDEPMLDAPLLSDLAALVRHTAVAGLTPAGVGRLLGELGARPRWRVHTYRHDFPDVSVLRPAMLARVLTGEDSVMRAQRLLRMVHRSAALVHANGA